MFELFINSISDFKRGFKKYIVLELIYFLLTSFIFVPLISFAFNRLLIALGSSFLLNRDVFKIVLSYKGIIGLLIIASFVVVAIYIEVVALIVIAQRKYFSKDVHILQALYTGMKSIPRLLFFGIIQLFFILFLFIPFIDVPISQPLLEAINPPIVLRNTIFNTIIWTGVYIITFIFIIILQLKWIFVLHYIIIDGKSTINAIKASAATTNDNKIKIITKLFILNIFFIIIGILTTSSFSTIPRLLNISLNYYLEQYLLTIASFLTLIFTLMLTPLNIIFITRLFYQAIRKRGEIIRDHLVIRECRLLSKIELRLAEIVKRRKIIIYFGLFVYLTATFFISLSVSESIIHLGRNVLIAAHRGDSINAPENTLSSVRLALDKGVDFVEVDVQITKDGVVVLNHDSTLIRVAGVPKAVHELTYDEISKLEVGSWFSKEFKGERIPTLEEVIREVVGRAKIIIDLKPYGNKLVLVEGVLRLIEEYQLEGECYVQSFDHTALRYLRGLNNNIIVGQIFYISVGNLAALEVDYYAVERRVLSDDLIKNAKRLNRGVWVWTVNEIADIREVLKFNIDGIITNYPERVQEIIGLNNSQEMNND